MDSLKLDLAALRSRMASVADEATWSTPEDLSRISVEAMASQYAERTTPSSGSIRVTGDGVQGHAAAMDVVGHIMSNWQRLVSAIGASHQGKRSVRGPLSGAVRSATRLLLTASPAPGSVVLNFVPEQLPESELSEENGPRLFGQPDTQLVDTAVNEAIELLELAVGLGPDLDDSPFVGRLKDLGPRTAVALTDFARVADAAALDTDVSWRQPGHSTRRATFTSSTARGVVQAVQSRELTKETVFIRGSVVTLSLQSNLVVRGDDGELYSVKRGAITPEMQKEFTIESDVELVAEVVFKGKPGDEPRPEYTALSMQKPRL